MLRAVRRGWYLMMVVALRAGWGPRRSEAVERATQIWRCILGNGRRHVQLPPTPRGRGEVTSASKAIYAAARTRERRERVEVGRKEDRAAGKKRAGG